MQDNNSKFLFKIFKKFVEMSNDEYLANNLTEGEKLNNTSKLADVVYESIAKDLTKAIANYKSQKVIDLIRHYIITLSTNLGRFETETNGNCSKINIPVDLLLVIYNLISEESTSEFIRNKDLV